MKVANAVHAAGESSERVPPGTYAVALQAPDLEGLRAALEAHGIRHVCVLESQGPYAGELMAIGLEPVADRSLVRKVVSSLPLVR